MTEQLSVQMSWGNGGCTRAGSPGDQQSRELGPWAARRSRAMMRANVWGHDELRGAVSYQFSQGLLTLMCNNSKLKADITFFFFLFLRQTSKVYKWLQKCMIQHPVTLL